MRKQTDVIQALFTLYTTDVWQDIEEFFEVAHTFLTYNGARFKLLSDVIDESRKSLQDQWEIDNGVISKIWAIRKKQAANFEEVCDNNSELQRLGGYEDSEQGFREEINALPTRIEVFGTVCCRFITFKYHD